MVINSGFSKAWPDNFILNQHIQDLSNHASVQIKQVRYLINEIASALGEKIQLPIVLFG